MKTACSIVAALAVIVAPLTCPVRAAGITSLSALGASPDTIDWSTVGSDFDILNAPLLVASAEKRSVTVTSAGGIFERLEQGLPATWSGGWAGDFPTNTAILFDYGRGPDITLTFASPVAGAGAEIEPDAVGDFTAQITVNGSMTFSEEGSSSYLGSPIFIGWVGPITTLEFSITNAPFWPNSFALGPVSIASAPEPSTWAMMALGFAGLCYVGYRRRVVLNAS